LGFGDVRFSVSGDFTAVLDITVAGAYTNGGIVLIAFPLSGSSAGSTGSFDDLNVGANTLKIIRTSGTIKSYLNDVESGSISNSADLVGMGMLISTGGGLAEDYYISFPNFSLVDGNDDEVPITV
jgi:hypothetical protein